MNEDAASRQLRRFQVASATAVSLTAVFGVLLGGWFPPQTGQAASAIGLLLGGTAVVGSCLAAALRSRGGGRLPWVLLAAAAGVALAGNLWAAALGADPVAAPSLVGEASLALAMVLSIAGLVALTIGRERKAQLGLMLLDGLVMGCAVLVITSIVVISQVVDGTGPGSPVRVMSLVLPVLDVVLVTVALVLTLSRHGSPWFFGLFGGGFLLYALADLAFAVGAAQGSFEFGGLIDLGWIAGYLILAAAAWHPHATDPPRPGEGDPLSGVQGTVLVFAVLLAALVVQLLHPHTPQTGVTQAVLWSLLVTAAAARQTVLAADNASLRKGLERRVRDQTADLRRMARETEALLSSVEDGIYGVDLDGRITFLNPSGTRTLGQAPGALLGKRAHEEFHAPMEDGEAFPIESCYVTEAIRHGMVSAAEEDVYLRPDGSTFPVEITASPLVDGDRVTGAVVVFRDVTQRHEVDRLKNEFLSVVSHELRTPLTSIRGSLGLLASGAIVELTPQAEQMVTIAVESSERLTRLINDILDIERIQSGRLPISLVAHEASDLLSTSATEIEGFAESAGVRLEVATGPGRVMADSDRVVQTLTNLIGNAIKFSTPGSTVWLETRADGDAMLFTVRDEGRGIPQESLESIFQPFEQVDSSDSRQKGGTGLGLAISRGIVEQHGGRIWIESVLGEGTTVRFTLPRAGQALPDDAGRDAPAILVCDDDPATVVSFAAMLGRHGYHAIGASGGEEAVQRSLASRPAAVLLDLVMPGTSGAQVMARLKAHPSTRHIPVVVVSGLAAQTDPATAGTAEGWLVKPVSEDRLIVAVTTALEGRRRGATVLIVEDDVDLARVLVTLLRRHALQVVHVRTVAEAVERGRELDPAVVVLDLELPDGVGSEVIERLRQEGLLQSAAVLVYTATDVTPGQALDDAGAVVLNKSRVTPEALEDRVLRLVDAVTGRSRGEVVVAAERGA